MKNNYSLTTLLADGMMTVKRYPSLDEARTAYDSYALGGKLLLQAEIWNMKNGNKICSYSAPAAWWVEALAS